MTNVDNGCFDHWPSIVIHHMHVQSGFLYVNVTFTTVAATAHQKTSGPSLELSCSEFAQNLRDFVEHVEVV